MGRTNELLLSSVEKVGPLVPTGSAWRIARMYPALRGLISPRERYRRLNAGRGSPYLKAGTGKPCAWHSRPKLCPVVRSNERLLSSVENLGALLPTGSARRGGGRESYQSRPQGTAREPARCALRETSCEKSRDVARHCL